MPPTPTLGEALLRVEALTKSADKELMQTIRRSEKRVYYLQRAQVLGEKEARLSECRCWGRSAATHLQRAHADLVLKGVYVEVIELAVVGVSLRTYAS